MAKTIQDLTPAEKKLALKAFKANNQLSPRVRRALKKMRDARDKTGIVGLGKKKLEDVEKETDK